MIHRGMIADRGKLVRYLREVSYYRLSAYWYPFREETGDNLKPGTSIDIVWRYYTFDRQLRLVVMDAIERVEVALRTQMVNMFTLAYGPFGHIDHQRMAGIPEEEHHAFLKTIRTETEKSKETFAMHFKQKYAEERDLPLWMACELMSFGTMLTFYKSMEKHMQKALAKEYKIQPAVLQSWLTTLNYIRNICAHHGRLWNRELAIKPYIPRDNMEWRTPVDVFNFQGRIYSVATILKYLLSFIAPQSKWPVRFEENLLRHPIIPIHEMGFPVNWKECPIWGSNY